MKRICFLMIAASLFLGSNAFSQKFKTTEGHIEIFSQTPVFTIEGMNKKVASIINFENGDIAVSTLVRSFKFHEALVEDHFNENYMDSEKYPKSSFKGKVTNYKNVDLKKNGDYKVTIKGDLTIHGTTNPVEVPGIISVKNGTVSGKTEFPVSLKAYNIKVEEMYKDAIKDEIKLTVNFEFVPLAN
jgi:polyisoprenoid-binding protein YceI